MYICVSIYVHALKRNKHKYITIVINMEESKTSKQNKTASFYII